MTKPTVLVTRKINIKGLSKLAKIADIEVWPEELPPQQQVLLEMVRGKSALLTMLSDKISAQVMNAAGSELKVISNYGVGFDNIDLKEATRRGIVVGNTPGILTDATADFAFALMMTAGRRINEAERFVHDGKWKTWMPATLLGMDFVGATLGIIGFGRIGQAVARRASGFSMRILFYDPTAEEPDDPNIKKIENLEDLVSQADYISLHVPATANTHHLVDSRLFELMKPNAILINTARGSVIDQEALYVALNDHKIAAAALDVTDPEPLPTDSPLLTLENCLITPHIASASHYAREKMVEMVADNIIAGLQGTPLPYQVKL